MKQQDIDVLKYKIKTQLDNMTELDRIKFYADCDVIHESGIDNVDKAKSILNKLNIDYSWCDLDDNQIIKESMFNWDLSLIRS